MNRVVDIAFADRKLEKRFTELLIKHRDEEQGGVLFWTWGTIGNMQWKRHQAIFGRKAIGIITDWLVCPNVSNLRTRQYEPSDIEQLVGIAEETAASRNCFFMHWHTHPNGFNRPSEGDKAHWMQYWNQYYSVSGAIACIGSDNRLNVRCHTVLTERGTPLQTVDGHFYHWNWINHLIRRYEQKGKRRISR